jgi:dethiobiotin synthetase
MSAFFVTGTGTDIGKTFVTAGLIRLLRGTGTDVAALKPIVSGFDPGNAAASDPGVLLGALGEPLTEEALDRISPWRFAAPLSPDMAAAAEDREIDFDVMADCCRDAIKAAPGAFFLEGVGGVMVPLDARHTVLDWMTELRLGTILVAGSYLGSISHTLTALECLKQRALMVNALVISETGDGAVPTVDTVETIRRFAPEIAIAVIPRVANAADAKDNFADLWGVIR